MPGVQPGVSVAVGRHGRPRKSTQGPGSSLQTQPGPVCSKNCLKSRSLGSLGARPRVQPLAHRGQVREQTPGHRGPHISPPQPRWAHEQNRPPPPPWRPPPSSPAPGRSCSAREYLSGRRRLSHHCRKPKKAGRGERRGARMDTRRTGRGGRGRRRRQRISASGWCGLGSRPGGSPVRRRPWLRRRSP